MDGSNLPKLMAKNKMQQMDFGPNESTRMKKVFFCPQLNKQNMLKINHSYPRTRLTTLDP
jgi:hypothetical protein